jgi:formylglycine-generating enzyme required for sulfatase activity
MFRQLGSVALLLLTTLGPVGVATAGEAPAAGGTTKSPPKQIAVDLGGGLKLELVLIPAGGFLMGSPDADKRTTPDETPQHWVRINRPFYLGKYPVTQEQWQAVMGSNPSRLKQPKDPVEMVNWDHCQVFLGKLNAKTGGQGGKFVLPTEAQWEYACRAGSAKRYCFGDDQAQLGAYAWNKATSGDIATHPVGQKKPNAWGLYDMHGNVWEWCQDWYDEDYYVLSPADDPTGPAEGTERVHRGGMWSNSPAGCRAAFRTYDPPTLCDVRLGLRVAQIPADNPVPTNNSVPSGNAVPGDGSIHLFFAGRAVPAEPARLATRGAQPVAGSPRPLNRGG